jgi:hypothetical protein
VLEVTIVPGAQPQGAPRIDSSQPVPVLVVCECAADHAGRPSGRTGCGRAGYLELVTEQP